MEYREFRAESVGLDDEGVIEGLVTPFGSETVIGDLKHGGWREEMAKGAFLKTLREGDPLMVNQHNLAQPLARKSAGNLELREGQYEGREGLVVKANPVDTSYARDLRALVKAKVIRGMSFGFNVVKDDWYDDDGNPSDRIHGVRRVVREVKLIEVSPVTRPAYQDTAIAARDESYALLELRGGDEERGPKPYGDVAYADPKNGKYPIDAKHVKAAWAYINQAKNAAKYPLNGVSLASVKAKIKAAMKKFGHAVSGEAKNFDEDFFNPEWREDDPYLDDWYEIDADFEDEPEGKSERDDPDGKEYAAIDEALRHLRQTPPKVKEAIAVLQKNQQGRRDDPDGKEYECIDRALRHLREEPPDVKSAISVLHGNQKYGRGPQDGLWDREQEPDSSTPEVEIPQALLIQMNSRKREIELEQ